MSVLHEELADGVERLVEEGAAHGALERVHDVDEHAVVGLQQRGAARRRAQGQLEGHLRGPGGHAPRAQQLQRLARQRQRLHSARNCRDRRRSGSRVSVCEM